jgi:hypothetical protein
VKSRFEAPSSAAVAIAGDDGGYLRWSRDPAVGLFAVLPLWLLYEGLRCSLVPGERNGAEVLLLEELRRFGNRAPVVFSALFGILMLVAARSLVRRQIPWVRVSAVIALEGAVYALLLGPIAEVLTSSAGRFLAAGSPQVANLVGSLGAGIFEELVFRLGLMSALVWLLLQAVRAWSLPAGLTLPIAIIVSALVFSWFHHACGEPFDRTRFTFRTIAGVLLGVLMWTRGYGVCVYTHALYNVYFYMAHGER